MKRPGDYLGGKGGGAKTVLVSPRRRAFAQGMIALFALPYQSARKLGTLLWYLRAPAKYGGRSPRASPPRQSPPESRGSKSNGNYTCHDSSWLSEGADIRSPLSGEYWLRLDGSILGCAVVVNVL